MAVTLLDMTAPRMFQKAESRFADEADLGDQISRANNAVPHPAGLEA